MTMRRYVALLRGINVGGRNKVAMADLREAFAIHGFAAVATYIQSGNVLFESAAPPRSLETAIEAMLAEELSIQIMVVVRSRDQMSSVVGHAPAGYGSQPDRYHSDAVFLKPPLTPAHLMTLVELRDGVDRAWPGSGMVYFQRLSARRSQSRLSRIMGTSEYANMTIRSWRTTLELLKRLEG